MKSKLLSSGVKVSADDYTYLVVWKQHFNAAFKKWVKENNTEPLINLLTKEQFNLLLKFARKYESEV